MTLDVAVTWFSELVGGVTLDGWNVAGTWFSGVATLIASGVALYLANPISRLRLRVEVEVLSDEDVTRLRFRVENASRTSVVLKGIDLSIRTWGRSQRIFCEMTDLQEELLPGHRSYPYVITGTAITRSGLGSIAKGKKLGVLRLRIHTGSGIQSLYPGDHVVEALENLPTDVGEDV